MNALYSMAQGKVVCGGAEVESSILYQGEMPPVFNLQPDENFIFEVFEHILASRTSLESEAYMSRRFVERYHDSLKVAEKYVECWKSI